MTNSKITTIKTNTVGKDPHADPNVTPWDEELENPVPASKGRGRSFRDWMVLFIAAMLVFYILAYLFVGPDTGSRPASGGSNFFFSSGSIAVIPLKGEIGSQTTVDAWGYQDIVDALNQAEDDPAVTVIFLDIDSGGGSVVASKQIVAKLRDVNKPVVSWIGDVGASGAYYAAAATDYVMADADSITGSIGVISVLPNVSVLMEKLGVDVNTIKTGELKDIGSPFDSLSENERAVFQDIVDGAFERFTRDVIAFRGDRLDRGAFDEVLDGRIISGARAKQIGLIDEIGTREQALTKAAEMGGIPGTPTQVTYLEHTFSLWDILFSMGTQFGAGIRSGVSSGTNADAQASIQAR